MRRGELPHLKLLPGILFALLSSVVSAQSSTSIPEHLLTLQGTVVGPQGQPLAGVRVDVRPRGIPEDVLADTVTDVEGNFAFVAIPIAPGRYAVHASGIGFEPVEQRLDISVEDAAYPPFNFKLKPQMRIRGMSSAFTVVRVFYATDRQSVTDNQSVQYIGIRSPHNTLSYGTCDVSIPETHTIAEIERPSVWKLEFHADPEKHMVLQKVAPESKDVFFNQVSTAVSSSHEKDAFVFIHGYNISFETAAIRTAQLTYDFGFKGAPIFYSWPSKGSILGYLADESAADETTASLKLFLEDVANQSGASVVHVIAHSMGNRAVLPALAQLAGETQFANFSKFSSLVIAAPDVDRDFFVQQVNQIRKPQTKITLYVSQHDQALAVSHLLFHKEPRAGEGGSESVVLQGMDTVDVSSLSTDALGHSYYGDNSNVVRDVLQFLQGKVAPRPDLSRIPLGALAYWELLATAQAAR